MGVDGPVGHQGGAGSHYRRQYRDGRGPGCPDGMAWHTGKDARKQGRLARRGTWASSWGNAGTVVGSHVLKSHTCKAA